MERQELKIYTEEVTRRPAGDYLKAFCLDMDGLRNMKIADLGAGLGDFASEVNGRNKEMNSECIAVDPFYKLLEGISLEMSDREIFSVLNSQVKKQRTYGSMKTALTSYSTERNSDGISEQKLRQMVVEKVREIKMANNGKYLSESAEQMSLEDESIDLVLMQNFINRNSSLEVGTATANKILLEACRVLKRDGEIRIVPVVGFDWSDNEVGMFMSPDGFPISDGAAIWKYKQLQEKGLNFYLTKTTMGTMILSIRKDEQAPVNFAKGKFPQTRHLDFGKADLAIGIIPE